MENQTAFTTGPWRHDASEDRIKIYSNIGSLVAVTETRTPAPEDMNDKFSVETIANAHLIAAAPEMNAYLQMEEDRLTLSNPDFKAKYGFSAFDEQAITTMRRAALAKANGR